MKILNSTLSALSIMFAFLFFQSCDSNRACEDIICGLNQQCIQGSCVCIDGYEGTNCQDLAYLKYERSGYNISETCQNGAPHNVFFGSIFASVNPVNELVFPNFLNSGQNALAYIGTDINNQGNYIRFPNQNLGGSGFAIVGEGFYEDFGGVERIRLEIQSTENGQVKFCTLFYQ